MVKIAVLFLFVSVYTSSLFAMQPEQLEQAPTGLIKLLRRSHEKVALRKLAEYEKLVISLKFNTSSCLPDRKSIAARQWALIVEHYAEYIPADVMLPKDSPEVQKAKFLKSPDTERIINKFLSPFVERYQQAALITDQMDRGIAFYEITKELGNYGTPCINEVIKRALQQKK